MKDVSEIATKEYKKYLQTITPILSKVVEADNSAIFRSTLNEAINLSIEFEKKLSELLIVSKQQIAPTGIVNLLRGLRNMGDDDLESAKIEVAFLKQRAENEYSALFK